MVHRIKPTDWVRIRRLEEKRAIEKSNELLRMIGSRRTIGQVSRVKKRKKFPIEVAFDYGGRAYFAYLKPSELEKVKPYWVKNKS